MFNIKPKSKDEMLTILILIEYQDCTIYNSYMKMAAQASKRRKSSFLTPNLTLFILRAFDQLIFKSKNLIVLHSRYSNNQFLVLLIIITEDVIKAEI